MTGCRRGDVVLVLFPNSDLMTYKKRPALIVQSEGVPTGLQQRIVALITGNTRRIGPSRVPISKRSPEGSRMGILHDSVVVTDNLATVLDRQVDRVIGACPVMDRVDAALRAILAL